MCPATVEENTEVGVKWRCLSRLLACCSSWLDSVFAFMAFFEKILIKLYVEEFYYPFKTGAYTAKAVLELVM